MDKSFKMDKSFAQDKSYVIENKRVGKNTRGLITLFGKTNIPVSATILEGVHGSRALQSPPEAQGGCKNGSMPDRQHADIAALPHVTRVPSFGRETRRVSTWKTRRVRGLPERKDAGGTGVSCAA